MLTHAKRPVVQESRLHVSCEDAAL